MRALQWMAVQELEPNSSKESAFNSVTEGLKQMFDESGVPDWVVHYSVGGTVVDFENKTSTPKGAEDVISYKENPEKFQETIKNVIQKRKDTFDDYRNHFKQKNIDIASTLDSYTGEMQYSFDLYDLGKCIELLQGTWNENSGFFDMTHESTNTKYMLDKLDESWYLVPVVFSA